MIESVKIIHDWKHIKEYRFWADLFRWTGTQVREYTLRSEDFSNDFTLVIILENGILPENLAQLHERYPKALRVSEQLIPTGPSLEMKGSQNIWKKYLAFYLFQIVNGNLILTSDYAVLQKDIEMLQKLGDVYIDYQISYYRNAYSCFYENEEIVQDAQDAFVDAYIKICDTPGMLTDTVSYFYVKANLIRYMDETCKFLRQKLLLPVEKGLRFLDDALEIEPAFNNAYLLKGIISELDIRSAVDGSAFYSQAMEKFQYKKYCSYPRYLQARYYEKVLKDNEKALNLYKDSLDKDMYEYRAIYKLAMFEKKEKNYAMAEQRFKQICNILNAKEAVNYLQPREYEYLFKAYLELAKIYSYEGFNLDKYKEMVRKREYFCDKILDTAHVRNKAYEEIFGRRNTYFREETYHRFKTKVMECE